jgi:hypothetical protein
MGQTDQERLAELEAKHTFQNRTLRAIRVIAERAPPEEAQMALKAIGALANEVLAESERQDHDHRSSQ